MSGKTGYESLHRIKEYFPLYQLKILFTLKFATDVRPSYSLTQHENIQKRNRGVANYKTFNSYEFTYP